jgi:predicted nucleic acid-binding protein
VARYTVLYDACVLYPAPLRDLLVQLATANLFRAKWTEQIHEEWIRSVLKERPDLTRAQLNRARELMNRAVLDCIVEGYEYLIPAVTLPDPDDRHVVAAAIHARADCIVTSNLKDFPTAALSPYNLEAIHPDEFINYQIDLNEAAVVIAAQACCSRLRNPIKTGTEYLDTLEALSLPKTVAALRGYATVLSVANDK